MKPMTPEINHTKYDACYVSPTSDGYVLAQHMVRHYVAMANQWAGYGNQIRDEGIAQSYYDMAEEYGAMAREWHRQMILLEIEVAA
jgi:hypothetical protein